MSKKNAKKSPVQRVDIKDKKIFMGSGTIGHPILEMAISMASLQIYRWPIFLKSSMLLPSPL